MGIFAGILVFGLTIYIINKFDIKHKHFLIGTVATLLVLGGMIVFQIHNPQMGAAKIKLVNLVFCILSILLMYRIINRIVGKKYAQICIVLYIIFLNPIIYIPILSSQYIFLFLTLLAFDLLFEENIIKNDFIKLGVASFIISLANVLIHEGIFFILVYGLFILIQIMTKKESVKNGTLKMLIWILTFITITFSVAFIQNQIVKSKNIKEPYQNYFFNVENVKFNVSTIEENEKLYWNQFSNDSILGYLYDEEVKVGIVKLEIQDIVNFLDEYCMTIWTISIILAIICIFIKWELSEKSIYLILSLLVLIMHAFLVSNDMNAFQYRPYIFILVAVGLANIMQFISKEKIKNILDRVNKIVDIVIKSHVFKVIFLLLLCVNLMLISLKYSAGELGEVMYKSYFENNWIVILNYLPIAFVAIFMYVLTLKTSIAFVVTALLSYTITIINYAKMTIRNDNFLIGDILLIREAATTKFDYSIILNSTILSYILFFIVVSVLMYILIDRRKKENNLKLWKRVAIKITLLVLLLIVGMNLANKYYFSDEFYQKTKNDKNFQNAMWTDRNKYISRGGIYSFLHSYTELKQFPPEGYNEQEAKKKLESYEYSNIDENKKVNIISIMLESYNDFSKFEEIKFIKDPYKNFHQIQQESISGEIVTSIFGGGTINTERKFLSGASNIPNFRKETNSYVRYFKEQGYTVEGSHPAEGWFYSRNLVNSNIGFDRYYFNENRYNLTAKEYYHTPDNILLSDIITLYTEHRRNNINPYFSFSVTYQNHLPYGSTYLNGGTYIVRDKKFSEEEYNIINNYFYGIEDTGNQLYIMLQKLKNRGEPVVVILFGDHNPSLGTVYDALDINFDISTEEGFNNYYCTPYVIWANESAKKILKNNFIGEGETVSPNYLMNEFFEIAGYGGNEFMKASNEIKQYIPVISGDVYYQDGSVTKDLLEENQSRLNEYLKIEYYYMNEFKNK